MQVFPVTQWQIQSNIACVYCSKYMNVGVKEQTFSIVVKEVKEVKGVGVERRR